MKGIFKKMTAVCVTCIMVTGTVASNAYAYTPPEMVRVGLETVCKNVSSVTIKNSELLIGSEENGKFIEGTVVSYPAGFQVVPSNGTYAAVSGSMDFSQAKSMAEDLERAGLTAAPAFLGASGWTVYVSGATVQEVTQRTGREAMAVPADSNRVELRTSGKTAVVSGSGIIAQFEAKDNQGIMNLNGNQYRGRMEFSRKDGSGMTAINVTKMDDYLFGVVPSEMPPSFELEALKAQAVAARTYSITKFGNHKGSYQLCDKIHCQVYKGVSVETEKTNQAVTATSHQVICYNGQPIEAVFSAASGGFTEDSENVWNEPVPYLRGVKEINEVGQNPWTRTYSLDDITRLLSARGANIGSATDIVITKISSGGRIAELQIVGTSGTKTLEKDEVRTYFSALSGGSLPSKLFTINGKGGDVVNGTAYVGSKASVEYAGATENKSSLTNSAATFGITAQGTGTQVSDLDGKRLEVSGLKKEGTEEEKKDTQQQTNESSQTNNTNTNTNTNTNSQKVNSVTRAVSISTGNGSNFVFEGRGNGHGVGMSQWGAHGMALSGYTYDQILKHYYTGVTVE